MKKYKKGKNTFMTKEIKRNTSVFYTSKRKQNKKKNEF